jgi:hypothetical protein
LVAQPKLGEVVTRAPISSEFHCGQSGTLAVAEQEAVGGRNPGDRIAAGRVDIAGATVDRDAIAVAEAERVEPVAEATEFFRGDAAAGAQVKDIIGALHDRLVHRREAGIIVRRQTIRGRLVHAGAEGDAENEQGGG